MSRTWPDSGPDWTLGTGQNIIYDGLLKNVTLFILKSAKILKIASKNLY
jgi:hypothetical protein